MPAGNENGETKMDDKTLRKLKRSELLELLLEERKINEALEKELSEARTELEQRRVNIGKCGNIAEASLAVTEVFSEAQKAADIYLKNIRVRAEEILKRASEAAGKAGTQDQEAEK